MTSLPPAAVSRDQFARNLADSGVLTADELLHLPAGDTPAVVQGLIDAGRLTPYQADAVLGRRFDELRIGNYDVLTKLGAGGMGSVFKARHRKMKRVVALKLLAPEVARQGSFVQRFQREVETIAQLAHPNIVMAFDADECDAGHFLVMEFVNGRDLAGDVEKGGPLAIADAVECARQAAEGLAYAHRQGVVHRDVKPANLLRDQSGLVKVADLGLARLNAAGAQGSSITQAGGILGTVDYMPPEQALDSTTIDGRADIYSLGCTLYFLLTGRPVYQASSIMGLLLAHRDGPIPSARAIRPDVPASVDAALARMLAKKPADRPATMDDVCQTLAGLGADVQGLTARPAGPAAAPVKPASSVMDMGVTMDAPSPSAVRRVSELVVVLVEPSRTQAGIMRRMLEQVGITDIHPAASGQQALQLAREKRAQVFVSAMHLSDMTGLQLAEAARSAVPDAGLVLTSSAADLSEHEAALRALRAVLLPKPFDANALVSALAQATGRTASPA
ncbi:MAG: protein kinase domain-containing protein [Gemmataceae bacterium]